MLLTLELPVFPHAVLYQQSLSAAAVVAQAAGAPGAASAAAGAAGASAGVADIIRFQDPEVRWCLVVNDWYLCQVLLVLLAAALLGVTQIHVSCRCSAVICYGSLYGPTQLSAPACSLLYMCGCDGTCWPRQPC